MENNISIVTAFFDIGRGEIGEEFPSYLKRTTDTYFEYFTNLASLENEMVIFTSKEWEDRILKIRNGKPTTIITINLKNKFRRQLKAIKKIQENKEFRSKINENMILNIEYWSPEYVLINNLKAYFVNDAINKKLLTSSHLVSWVDFGYVRERKTLNNVKNWRYSFDKEKIHFFTIRKKYPLKTKKDVYEMIFNNSAFIIGGAIVGSKNKWKEFYILLKQNQNELLKENIVDDDQGLYMMSLFKKPEFFKLNYLGENNWFSLFERYDETSQVNLFTKIKNILVLRFFKK